MRDKLKRYLCARIDCSLARHMTGGEPISLLHRFVRTKIGRRVLRAL